MMMMMVCGEGSLLDVVAFKSIDLEFESARRISPVQTLFSDTVRQSTVRLSDSFTS